MATINISKKSGQKGLVDGLESNSNNMANKFSDRVIESTDSGAKLRHGAGSCPELLEITPLKNVSQEDDASNLRILELHEFIH